jgi:hypothetical protein
MPSPPSIQPKRAVPSAHGAGPQSAPPVYRPPAPPALQRSSSTSVIMRQKTNGDSRGWVPSPPDGPVPIFDITGRSTARLSARIPAASPPRSSGLVTTPAFSQSIATSSDIISAPVDWNFNLLSGSRGNSPVSILGNNISGRRADLCMTWIARSFVPVRS